jgi:phosphoglycerate dehydrogenase-like enzyme
MPPCEPRRAPYVRGGSANRLPVTCVSRKLRIAGDIESDFDIADRGDLDGSTDAAALVEALRGSWGVIASSERYSREVIEQLPGLRAISRIGTGADSIDVPAATENGIAVTVLPGINSGSVAEFTLALILSLNRNIVTLRTAPHVPPSSTPVGYDLADQTVGLLGFGSIGQALALRVRAFGGPLIAHDVAVGADKMRALGVAPVSRDELLARADVLSLHVPLMPATRGLIGRSELLAMKPGALLVNTARGGLVDEDSLLEALQNGHLRGAGLDVTATEPLPSTHPLRQLPQVIITPHVAAFTVGTAVRGLRAAIDNLSTIARGGLPPHCLNAEVLTQA